MRVRDWWECAKENDQGAVLAKLGESCEYAGVPWPFLPDELRAKLEERVIIDEDKLAPDRKQTDLHHGTLP